MHLWESRLAHAPHTRVASLSRALTLLGGSGLVCGSTGVGSKRSYLAFVSSSTASLRGGWYGFDWRRPRRLSRCATLAPLASMMAFSAAGKRHMSSTILLCTLLLERHVVDPPPSPALDQIWIRHATLLPKKEKSVNMPAPPPRPRRRRASPSASAAERDGWTQRPGIILFGLPTTSQATKYRGARPLVVTSAQSIQPKQYHILNRR